MSFYTDARETLKRQSERRKMEEDNVSHQHFISVLERAYNLFERVGRRAAGGERGKEDTAGEKSKGLDKEVAEVSNKFDVLEVEDVEEDGTSDVEETPVRPVPEPKVQKPTAEEERAPAYALMEERHAEAKFAAWCLYEDLKNVRTFIKKLWIKYKLRQITEVTVSITMTVAMELVASMEQNMKTNYPELNMYVKWATMLHLDNESKMKGRTIDKNDPAIQQLAELGMTKCYVILSQLMEFCDAEVEKLLMFPGTTAKLNPKSSRPDMTYEQQLGEDMVLVLGQVSDWSWMAQHGPAHGFNDDALLKHFREWQNSKDPWNPSITFLFALQIFLDSWDTMRLKLKTVFGRLQDFGRRYIKSGLNYLENDSEPDTSEYKKNVDATCEMYQVLILNDFIKKVHAHFQYPATEKNKPFSYLINNPWLTVGTLESSACMAYFTGMKAFQWGGFILLTVHAYNALRQEKFLEQPIPLFEFLMRTLGPRIFSGRVPAGDYWKYLKIALGSSAASFSKDVRKTVKKPNGISGSPKGGRQIIKEDDSFIEYIGFSAGTGIGNCNVGEAHATTEGGADILSLLDEFVKVSEAEQKETYKFGIDWIAIHSLCRKLMQNLYYDVPDLRHQMYDGFVKDDAYVTRMAQALVLNMQMHRDVPDPKKKAAIKKQCAGHSQAAAKVFIETAKELPLDEVFMLPGVKPPADLVGGQ
ncbi:hypothetical protein HDV00_002640 [Rhizophlyctis rosea]|nr:hypothetical protein HDV00_002640 [Rhizophlyctis rosea]